VRPVGIVPVLRQETVPPRADLLRRSPSSVPSEALAPQDSEAQDDAAGMGAA
jgi:hypothetical protein